MVNLKKHPSELLKDSWDKEFITKTINRTNSIPDLGLDKVEFHISGTCNLKCPFCYGSDFAPNKRVFLKTDSVCSVLDDVKKINPFIVLAGMYSEPLLHPEFNKIIKEIGNRGYRFGIYSNGFLLTDDKIKEIIEASSKNTKKKPSYISFNITSSVVINQFEKQLENIKKLIDNRGSSGLVVNGVLLSIEGKNNYNYMSNIVNRLKEVGVDNVRLSIPWGAQKLGDIEGLSVLTKLTKLGPGITIRYDRNYKKCYAMCMALSISPDGDVFPCPAVCSSLFKYRYSYGSIYEDKITDLWMGERHKQLFKTLDPRREKCVCCPMDDRFNNLCAELDV